MDAASREARQTAARSRRVKKMQRRAMREVYGNKDAETKDTVDPVDSTTSPTEHPDVTVVVPIPGYTGSLEELIVAGQDLVAKSSKWRRGTSDRGKWALLWSWVGHTIRRCKRQCREFNATYSAEGLVPRVYPSATEAREHYIFLHSFQDIIMYDWPADFEASSAFRKTWANAYDKDDESYSEDPAYDAEALAGTVAAPVVPPPPALVRQSCGLPEGRASQAQTPVVVQTPVVPAVVQTPVVAAVPVPKPVKSKRKRESEKQQWYCKHCKRIGRWTPNGSGNYIKHVCKGIKTWRLTEDDPGVPGLRPPGRSKDCEHEGACCVRYP